MNYSEILGVEGKIRKRGLMSRDNSTQEEVVNLKAEVSCMQSQLNAQTEQIKELKDKNQEMKDRMQDQFMHLTTLLMNRLGGQNYSEVLVPITKKKEHLMQTCSYHFIFSIIC